MTCRECRGRCWPWPRAWATCGRPTTAGSSRCVPSRRRPTWPSRGCRSPRIPTIPTVSRSLAPVLLPAARARSFYAAYRAFAERIADPEAAMTARLSPGDCVIVDNTRVLHGRTGFADGGGTRTTGRRHLQGCYADLDGL